MSIKAWSAADSYFQKVNSTKTIEVTTFYSQTSGSLVLVPLGISLLITELNMYCPG